MKKNRVSLPLPVCHEEVVTATGTQVFDPNGLAMEKVHKKIVGYQPVPGCQSLLSGGPAIVVRTSDVVVHLTPEEFDRWVGRQLLPNEFFKLLDHYGIFHEIHDDFYDELTGIAMQPMNDTQYIEDLGYNPWEEDDEG